MPGLVPGIHVFKACHKKDVDGRTSPAMTELSRPPSSFIEPARDLMLRADS
jgi:hypothetical protein